MARRSGECLLASICGSLRHTGQSACTVRGKCQDEFAALTKNIKVRRGESEEGYHTEKVL